MEKIYDIFVRARNTVIEAISQKLENQKDKKIDLSNCSHTEATEDFSFCSAVKTTFLSVYLDKNGEVYVSSFSTECCEGADDGEIEEIPISNLSMDEIYKIVTAIE